MAYAMTSIDHTYLFEGGGAAWAAINRGDPDDAPWSSAYLPYEDEPPRRTAARSTARTDDDQEGLASLYVLARAESMPPPLRQKNGQKTQPGPTLLSVEGMSPPRRDPMPYDIIRDALYVKQRIVLVDPELTW